MPPKKKKDDELLNIVSEMSNTLSSLNQRLTDLEQNKTQPIERPQAGKTTPEGYREVVDQILGPDFSFKIDMVEDQEMAIIQVPEKLRRKELIDAYISHWKSRRVEYEREINRRNPNLSSEKREQMMAEYDKKNLEPVVPDDIRSRAISTLKTPSDFRKWLIRIRENIKKELSVAKQENEIPTESLQEELSK